MTNKNLGDGVIVSRSKSDAGAVDARAEAAGDDHRHHSTTELAYWLLTL